MQDRNDNRLLNDEREATAKEYSELFGRCARIRRQLTTLSELLRKNEHLIRCLRYSDCQTWLYDELNEINAAVNELNIGLKQMRNSMKHIKRMSLFYQMADSELRYFSQEWQIIFAKELNAIFRTHDNIQSELASGEQFDVLQAVSAEEVARQRQQLAALDKLEQTMIENLDFITRIDANISSTLPTVIAIEEGTKQALGSVGSGATRVRRAKRFQSKTSFLKVMCLACALGVAFIALIILVVFILNILEVI